MDPHAFDDAQLGQELAQQFGDLTPQQLERLAHAEPPPVGADERGRITGRIVKIHNADVFVDMGAKAEGVIPLDEFPPDAPPQVGQTYSLVAHGFDHDSGLMRLSLTETKADADIHDLKIGDIVKGRVTGSNIGGLELRVQGLRGFMPMSQVDVVRHEDFKAYLHQWLECEITEIDRRGKNLVLSRRRVLERQREEDRQRLREVLSEGQVRRGIVRRLADFGAFVDLGGIDGLLHVSDISYSRIAHPRDVLKEGAEIEVKILKIDDEKGRISLGLKQLAADPWTLAEGKYRAGETIEGRITKLMDFGAFVEVEQGIEGLIPISEMSWTQRIHHPKDILKAGDGVRVVVLACDPAKHKLSLSLKALGEDPWRTVAERYPINTLVTGNVTRITNFGAFLGLEEGIEGLVHISELSHQRVRAVGDVLKVGEVVQVRVLSVDADQRRISLSLKAAQEQPMMEAAPAPEPAKPRKRKRELRGGLTW